MRITVGSLLFVTALFLPGGASAAVRKPVASIANTARPPRYAVAGNDLAYVGQRRDHTVELRWARAGQPDRVVRAFGRLAPSTDDFLLAPFIDVQVDATPGNAAAAVATGTRDRGGGVELTSDDVFAGARRFEDFCFPRLAVRDLALDAGRVAYTSGCGGAIAVRDVASGALVASPPTGGEDVAGIDLAGRFLAWQEGKVVTVYDLAAAAVSYRASGYGSTFALQADGKLALVDPDGVYTDFLGETVGADDHCAKVEWVAPSAPAATHRLPGCLASLNVAIARDRVAYVLDERNRHAVVLADLNGRGHKIASPAESVDWDGRRVAYGSRTCDGGVTLFVTRRTAVDVAEDVRCSVGLRSRLVATERPRLKIACADGCTGTVELRSRDLKTSLSSTGQFTAGPGGVVTVNLTLTAHARDAGRTGATAVFTLADRLGRPQTVRRTVTLTSSRN